MSEVKRYECTDTIRNYMHSCGMEEDSLGDYICDFCPKCGEALNKEGK